MKKPRRRGADGAFDWQSLSNGHAVSRVETHSKFYRISDVAAFDSKTAAVINLRLVPWAGRMR